MMCINKSISIASHKTTPRRLSDDQIYKNQSRITESCNTGIT